MPTQSLYNTASVLGPNKWYENGDECFHPENLIWSGRQTNIIGIINKKTGNIVWQLGPDYSTTPALVKLGWIVGQHHAHMIPRGLPGEGNILIFDNGGGAGYGAPNPGSRNGVSNALRDYSRVLEIDPTTLEVVWKCGSGGTPDKPSGHPMRNVRLFSNFISSAQRLPNGNTLITEGISGRFIEVTPTREVVWEYVSPYFNRRLGTPAVYRAYRLPYQWVPQAKEPVEKTIPRINNSKFRVPGSPNKGALKTSIVNQP